jgi:hypothetical protein
MRKNSLRTVPSLILAIISAQVIFPNPSSALSTYAFTNAASTGRNGPTQTQINSAYSGTSLAGAVTINTQGVQEWVVPASGSYQIDIAGAAGGVGISGSGGNGAVLSIKTTLASGTRLAIVVGQKGGAYNASNSYPGGSGGGGSFIYKLSDNSYIAAAGGGGGGPSSSSNLLTSQTTAGGKYDTTTASTVTITGNFYAPGGVNGAGGGKSTRNQYHGGPGAGVNSDGATSNGGQGRSRLNGWIGGGGNGTYPVEGGFGGGGASGSESASSYGWAGGGGGYSGGGCGGNGGNSDGQYGGGGSSYYIGQLLSGASGSNTGHGYVTFTQLAPPVVGVSISGSATTVSKGNSIILSASTDTVGVIAFYADGKRIANCLRVNAPIGTVSCSWKPTVQKVVLIKSVLIQSGSIVAESGSISVAVVKRTGTR